MNKKTNNKDETKNIINTCDVTTITPTNQAIYEAGKSMLIESINTGREFCKFMIGTSMSAIPIYIALSKFILPDEYIPTLKIGILLIIPTVLFLVSAIVFLLGYFPQKGIASLDIPEEIEHERQKTVKKRHRLGALGFSIFCIAVLSGLITIGYILRLQGGS